MSEKIEFDDMLKKIEKADLQDLMEQSMYNPDPDKRKLYDALYTYALDKQQEKLIKRKEFIV
ncbi:hypothetical protein [Companilactobacillus muriivasis]|uniref:hypothetical protein n=1 Tax=Companilactobacillus muriivasis TaxID=3081444 RepID=UPI0030C718DF